MEREEWEERRACADCGALVADTSERAFAFGRQGVLCWQCAIRRGGSYDARQDRWTSAPDVADLRDEPMRSS